MCRFIDLPQFSDRRGNLSFIENGGALPFDVKRFYFLYDVPFGVERAGTHTRICIKYFRVRRLL